MKTFKEMDFLSQVASVMVTDIDAKKFLMKNFEDEEFSKDLEVLFNNEIIGKRVSILFKEACLERMSYYKFTLELFRMNIFTKEEILKNLDSEKVVPFIDESIFAMVKVRDFSEHKQGIYELHKEKFNEKTFIKRK